MSVFPKNRPLTIWFAPDFAWKKSTRTSGSSFAKSSYAASNASCQNLGNLPRRLLVYTSHMCFTTFSLLHFQNIEIVVDVGVEVVGNMVEVAGGPPESNGAGEHRPESEEQNRCQRPELVPTPPKNTRIWAIFLRICGQRRCRKEIIILHCYVVSITQIFRIRIRISVWSNSESLVAPFLRGCLLIQQGQKNNLPPRLVLPFSQ